MPYNAQVSGNALVCDDAQVYGTQEISSGYHDGSNNAATAKEPSKADNATKELDELRKEVKELKEKLQQISDIAN